MSDLLDKFRTENPAYADRTAWPDAELADGLYRKFYADRMSREDFNQRVGAQPAAREKPRERATFLPLAEDETGKIGLGVPGLIYHPYKAFEQGWQKLKAGARPEDVAPEAFEAASAAVPGAGRAMATRQGIGRAVEAEAAETAAFGPRSGPSGLEKWTTPEGNLRPELESKPGWWTPQSEAVRRVRTAATKDIEAETGRALQPGELESHATAEIEKGKAAEQPVKLMDVGGENTRSLMRSSANKSPTARGELQETIQPRSEQQATRMTAWLRKVAGGDKEAFQLVDQIRDAARSPNSQAYRAAFEQGSGGIRTPGLDRLMASKLMQDVYKDSIAAFEAKRVAGRVTGPQSVEGKPTLEFWDLIKRGLDDKVNSARQAGNRDLAGTYASIRDQLIHQLDREAPKYADARGIASRFFKASDSVEAGEMVAKGTYTAAQIKRVTDRMKPNERAMFQAGFMSEYLKALSFTGERRDIVKILANSEGERAKLAAVLGEKTAAQMEAVLHVEKIMERARTALGNSTTTQQALDVTKGGGLASLTVPTVVGVGVALAGGGVWGLMMGALTYGAKTMGHRYEEAVAERVAKMLVSDDPAVYRKGIAEVAKSQTLMQSLRAYVDKQLLRATPLRPMAGRAGAEDAEQRRRNAPRTRGLPGEVTSPLGEAAALP